MLPTMSASRILFGRNPQQPERVSLTPEGGAASRASHQPSLSRDGRVVAFASDAADLVAGDGNYVTDLFVRTPGEALIRVSVSSEGAQGNEISGCASLSADGRRIAFQSRAWSLVDDDDNHAPDIFVRDLDSGRTICVSRAADGSAADGSAWSPAISADGRRVAFSSNAPDLAGGDTNGKADVFVHDLATGETLRASVTADNREGNGASEDPALSADGRFVAFASSASNLVGDDANRVSDVFVRDLVTGNLECVSLSVAGGTANLGSARPSISSDGRYVAFQSFATDLIDPPAILPTGFASSHVYVHDRSTRRTHRVDPETSDGRPMGDAYFPMLSADGTCLVWQAAAKRDARDADPVHSQVFVADLTRDEISRVSGPDAATPGNGSSYAPAISGDASTIAFSSEARNLVTGSPPRAANIYLVSNPLTRVRALAEAAIAQADGQEKPAPEIQRHRDFVVIDGVRVPVRA